MIRSSVATVWRSCMVAAFAAGLAGCGDSGPRHVPVQGKVTLTDGSPVK